MYFPRDRRMRVAVPLARDFPPSSRDQWLAEVTRVLLKGEPNPSGEEAERAFERRLVSHTDDGISLQPLYTADDGPKQLPLPGQAPYLRGTHAGPRPWEIRQRVWSDAVGSSAVRELESGATGVLLTIAGGADAAAAVRDGLEGVLLDLVPVTLSASSIDDQLVAARTLLALWDSIGVDARQGGLGLDPMGAWARSGGDVDLDVAMDEAAAIVRDAAQHAPHARALVMDGTVWHDAGATDAQELAWTIATGVWVARQLVDRGVDLAQAVSALEFRLAATDDQFGTIAKIRAARVLWARVCEVAGLAEADRRMVVHAEVSRAMLTRYDIWVNALRSTVACFAAAVGGADAITVLPHDVLMESGGSSLGRRVARNTQTILQMESHLDRVVDPAGGSWFVESLTEALEGAAWQVLQNSEVAGGIVAMLESGALHAALEEALAARLARIATRQRPLTGLTEFPNIDDAAPPAQITVPKSGTRFAPLGLHRLADEFEVQRGRADRAAEAAERPAIFLAGIGTPAQSTARVTFAKNFFEVAGIRTVSGPVEDFAGSGAAVACLCSSDAVYADSGADAVAQLRHGGASRVYLAGRGVGIAGVDEEIGLGVDVLDVLTRALDHLGVPR